MSRIAASACVRVLPIAPRSNRRFISFADSAVGPDAVTTMGTPARFSWGCDTRPAHGCQDRGRQGNTVHPKHPIPAPVSRPDILNNTSWMDCENTRPHRQMKVRLFCFLHCSTAETRCDANNIWLLLPGEAAASHYQKKERERGEKKTRLWWSFVCVF